MAGEIFSIAGLAFALTVAGIAVGYGILWVWNGGSFSEEE
ncbi:MAG: PetM family cytochrome b6-f complex subunit 7 [Synechococcus sp.]